MNIDNSYTKTAKSRRCFEGSVACRYLAAPFVLLIVCLSSRVADAQHFPRPKMVSYGPQTTDCGEPFGPLGHGEYIGPPRMPHVPEYLLRIDDTIVFRYRVMAVETGEAYRLQVGDVIEIDSLVDDKLDRKEVVILNDGTIFLHLLGRVRASRRTVEELSNDLTKQYKDYIKKPEINITVLKPNARLEELRRSVVDVQSNSGQVVQVRVNPEGSIALPGIGRVQAHGLSLGELAHEVNRRYAAVIPGIEVTPGLAERAPRFIFVTGAVNEGGRFDLVGPTSVTAAIALARGFVTGANLRQVVVLRRGDDWRMKATLADVRPLFRRNIHKPAEDIWLRDGDVVIVPKSPLLEATDLVDLVFTKGVYAVAPATLFTQGAVLAGGN